MEEALGWWRKRAGRWASRPRCGSRGGRGLVGWLLGWLAGGRARRRWALGAGASLAIGGIEGIGVCVRPSQGAIEALREQRIMERDGSWWGLRGDVPSRCPRRQTGDECESCMLDGWWTLDDVWR